MYELKSQDREQRFHRLPLEFEPGEGWTYGTGIDVAGSAVEKVTGMRLGDYMAKHIFEPLNMTSSTFRPASDPKVLERLMTTTLRASPDAPLTTTQTPYATESKQDVGGAGLFSTATDYIQLLKSILRNDGNVLKPESVDVLFKPQIKDTRHLEAKFHHPMLAAFLAPGYDTDLHWNHSIAGRLVQSNVPGRQCKGTLGWGGMPNLKWVSEEAV